LWLEVALILVVLPHLPRLAIWVPAVLFLLLAWRYVITRQQWHLPPQMVQIIIAFAIFGGILLNYGTIFGRDAGVALLIALIGMKLLEMRNPRDALLICFLGYFLIITNFLYSQSIPTALYMGVVMIVMTTTLVSLSDKNLAMPSQQRMRLAVTLLVQAVPIMLVLFVLFPRVAGPFWSLPKDAHSGQTGLSDSMTMGDIGQLSLSDEVAFRVKFNGTKPHSSQLYWRGPVLWWSNGRTWRGLSQSYLSGRQRANIQPQGEPISYTVTLEPHNKEWLFALELPLHVPSHLGSITSDYQFLAKRPIRERIRYELQSYPTYQTTRLTNTERNIALRVPANRHPRARMLAEEWTQTFQEPIDIVQQALRYFNEEEFYYTLNPDVLFDDPVDEFLFETQEGFCEHYAAAFTVLMRAAGIPARVVTGYLGGELNPLGDYLVVRQRDAHAWSEVWLDNQGWVRIDPTAAVAPERIEQGIDNTLPQELRELGLESDWQTDSALAPALQYLSNSWDAVNNTWNQWVLGYGPEQQQRFLSQLGLGWMHWGDMVIMLTVIIAVFLILISIWLATRYYRVTDPIQKVYLRFCYKLAKQGLKRQSSEGALDFSQRVIIARPDLTESVQQITDLYLQARYRSQSDLLPQLQVAVRRFHP